MNVVVVGAGLGGLSAACHLVGRGHEVLVLERGDIPGGRAGLLERGGYRFETGPTVLTMTDLIADCIRAAGSDMADLLTLKPVDPMYRACYEDGSVLRVWHGRERMAEEIRDVCGPGEAEAFRRFCDWLTDLYHLEMPNFIDRNFDSPVELAWPLGPALRLVRMGGFRKLANVVGSYFDDDRLRRIFSFQSMYAGLAPYEALAIYCVITYMDSVAGVFVPEGGMHAVPVAMADAAAKAGVEFRYGTTVDRIVLAEGTTGAVRGVRIDTGEVVAADAVVCNPDLPVAYRTLVPGLPAPRSTRRGAYSPSCVVWHAGVRGVPPEGTAHHNIHFGRDWDGAFRALLHDGIRMPDPSILVTVHSLDDAKAAPQGCSTLDGLEPTPNLDGRVDWTQERARVRDQLAARVAALGYPSEIEVEELVDPLDWERDGMERGTPFALSHRFFQTGPFRPNNIDKRAPGLVFVGSGTLPGVGVPMVLVSGRLAAERVDDLKAGRGRHRR
ncbi:phytoene desaturase family protein [soil metagenome]